MRGASKLIQFLLSSTITLSSLAIANEVNVKVIAEHKDFNKLIANNSQVTLITNQADWSEGPVCTDNDELIFSDVTRNKVQIWSEQAGLKDWLNPSDYQNGHAIDRQGRILAASHGQRALLRQEKDGTWVSLVNSWDGKKLHSPNDVAIAPDDTIWFTDPLFGLLNEEESYGGKPKQDGEHIYKYDPVTRQTTQFDITKVRSPNGLAFSPDGRLLYVADSERAHDFNDKSLESKIVVYRVTPNGLRRGRVFTQIDSGVPDGIKVDTLGNVWSSSKEGIQIFSKRGKRLGKILVPANATGNLDLCTDSKGKNWLYVTASELVFRMPVLVSGAEYSYLGKNP